MLWANPALDVSEVARYRDAHVVKLASEVPHPLPQSASPMLAAPTVYAHHSPRVAVRSCGPCRQSLLTGAIELASKLSVFLTELKRRRVYRVAVAYAVVGTGIIGVADAALPDVRLVSV